MKKWVIIAAVLLFSSTSFAAQRLEPLATFFNNTGGVGSSYKLFTYEPGTTTKKTTYKNPTLATAHTNPIVLNSAGRPTDNYPIYFANAIKYVLAPSTDTDPPASALYTVDNYNGSGALADNVYYYLSSYSTLAAAATALNALNADCTLVIDEDYAMVANVSFDAEVRLLFAPGNVITTNNGATTYTLTIGGGPAKIIAGPTQQCFGGTGTVTFSINDGIRYPDWWGVDGTADQVQINYAIASVTGGTVKLVNQYTVSDSILLVGDEGSLIADGWHVSVTLADSLASGVEAITNYNTTTGNDGWNINGFTIDCNRTGSPNANYGIYLYNSHKNHIENLQIKNATRHAIALETCDENWVQKSHLLEFGETSEGGFGILLIRGSEKNHIIANHLETTQDDCKGIIIDDYSTSGNSYDSSFNFIHDNTVIGTEDGLVIQGCNNNSIKDNNFISQLRYGMEIGAGTTGDNARADIQSKYNLIKGNNIYSPTYDGINISTDYNVINDNDFYTVGRHGVFADSACVSLSIKNCTFIGFGENAIKVDGGQQVKILNNDIIGIAGFFGADGMFLTSDDGTLKWSKISGNTFYNIGDAGIMVVKGTGTLLKLKINDNDFYNVSENTPDAEYCITVTGACSGFRVHDNSDMDDSDSAGILNMAISSTNLVYGNGTAQTMDWDFNEFGLRCANATSGALTGATDTIEVNIPSGALILGISLNNAVVVVDSAGDNTYTAAFSGGLAVAINGGAAIAAAANTKTKEMFTQSTSMLTAGETDITLTPNGGNFSSGEVRASVWYMIPPASLPDV